MTALRSRMDAWRHIRILGIIADIGNFVLFAVRRYHTDRMMQAVGALTYSTLLALVPLMVIAFAIFSAFPAFDEIQQKLQGLVFEKLVPEFVQDVRVYLAGFTQNARSLTAAGVVLLALSAVLLLSTIEATLNTVWRVDRPRPIMVRLLMFWTVLTLGPLLLGASFTLTSDVIAGAWQWAEEGYDSGNVNANWSVFERPVAALIQSIAFTLLFLLVPARSVRLRDAAIGGVISGVTFELLKWGLNA